MGKKKGGSTKTWRCRALGLDISNLRVLADLTQELYLSWEMPSYGLGYDSKNTKKAREKRRKVDTAKNIRTCYEKPSSPMKVA